MTWSLEAWIGQHAIRADGVKSDLQRSSEIRAGLTGLKRRELRALTVAKIAQQDASRD
jgi:hypothetical protein